MTLTKPLIHESVVSFGPIDRTPLLFSRGFALSFPVDLSVLPSSPSVDTNVCSGNRADPRQWQAFWTGWHLQMWRMWLDGNTAVGGEGESFNDVIRSVHATSFRDISIVVSVKDNEYQVMKKVSVIYCTHIFYALLLISGAVMATVRKEIGPTSGP
jgi:hypothetical protein